MSTRCYIGATDPDDHLVHARYVHSDGYPSHIVSTLSRVLAGRANGDPRALLAAILEYDWDYLDAAVTPATTSSFAGQRPVPGVGMTLAAANPDGSLSDPQPIHVFPLSQAGQLDAAWIYLLDPATATVTAHTSDGEPVARYPLAATTEPASTHRRRTNGRRQHRHA